MAVKRTEAKTPKAASARKPAVRRKRAVKPLPEHVAVRAYFLHLEGGQDAFENWIRAERELAA